MKSNNFLILGDKELVLVFAAVSTEPWGSPLICVELNTIDADAAAPTDAGQVFVFPKGKDVVVFTAATAECAAWPQAGR